MSTPFHTSGDLASHLATQGIRDPRVLAAIARTPRHLFFEHGSMTEAYANRAVAIGHGQTISQPYMVARTTELLGLRGGERVLEVGAGSGYQAAVMAAIADHVYAIERIPELAEQARATLALCGIDNVTILLGDGTKGDPEHAPFDAIAVSAAAPEVPRSLVMQLAVGGRLVIPVGDRALQTLRVITRVAEDAIEERTADRCIYVPLVGEHGWTS